MEHLSLSGSYHEIGTELGKRTEESLKKILKEFKNSDIYEKTSQYIKTSEGAHVLSTFKDTVKKYCGNYLEEFNGLADGAGVDVNDLFLLNCDSEFAAILEETPGSSHDVLYSSLYDGCTNISMETDAREVYLAHTEDIGPFARDLGVMLTAKFTVGGKVTECWTDYHVPGILSGSKFFFNSHGIMAGANTIYQKGVNRNGIPRKFMCRSLMGIRDASHAIKLLQKQPGIATAYCFQYLQRTCNGVENTVIEVAGTFDGSHVTVFKPKGYYHHCNMFQHLHHECHPEESSVHRAAVISQYVNRGQTRTKRQLLSAISNRQDTNFPVHRNGQYPDYLATGSTGIFDVAAGTMEVYTDIPENSQPQHVFKVPKS
ncbi:uncharacterized protein LOC128558931 isoform X2 [Mercenaria mercenaria]|uniref:uncharacterized protein LOC128558931 isoform X2 n=1 Tax=Mercenaria mercenaria TaxID=6596 RepID=UPI00234F1007|nr:uncharacterized protein LOC128558931 isoform X2 [Mercenaria mercenaria]